MFIIDLKVFIENPLHAKYYAHVTFIRIILPQYFPDFFQHTPQTYIITTPEGTFS